MAFLKEDIILPPEESQKCIWKCGKCDISNTMCPNIKSHTMQSSGVSAGDLKFVLNMKQCDCKF